MTTQGTCTGTMSSEILCRLAELVHFILYLLFFFFSHCYHFSHLTTSCIRYSIKATPIGSLLNTFPSFLLSISPHFSLFFHFLLSSLDVKGICEYVLVPWQYIYSLRTVSISVSLSTLLIFVFFIFPSVVVQGEFAITSHPHSHLSL